MNCKTSTEHADITSINWQEVGGLEVCKLVTEGNDGGLEIQKFENSNEENF